MEKLIDTFSVYDRPRAISVELYNRVKPTLMGRVARCIEQLESTTTPEFRKSLSKKRSTHKIFESAGESRGCLMTLYSTLVLIDSLSAGLESEINYG